MKEHNQGRKRGPKPSWPRIRARGTAWVVDCGRVFGKRERSQFDSLEEAEKHAEAQRKRRATLRDHSNWSHPLVARTTMKCQHCRDWSLETNRSGQFRLYLYHMPT